MDILVVTNMYPNEDHLYYGIFVKEFVESLQEKGINVDVIFINGRKNKFNYILSPVIIFNKLRAKTYDIVHIQHTFLIITTFIAQLFCFNFRPRVLTFHEGEFSGSENFLKELKGENKWIKRIVFSKLLKKFLMKLSNFCIFVNKEIAEEIRLKKTKYTVLPPGINLNLFKPIEQNKARQFLHLPKEKIIIFFPANPTMRRKGFSFFEKSIIYLSQDIKQDLKIITGGNIKREEMVYYINASDLIIQTSLFEASPMIVKETMSIGKPMISTDIGDVKGLFNGVTGYYITSLNPEEIAKYISLGLKFKRSTNGRKKIIERGMNIEEVARRTISIYKKLLHYSI